MFEWLNVGMFECFNATSVTGGETGKIEEEFRGLYRKLSDTKGLRFLMSDWESRSASSSSP